MMATEAVRRQVKPSTKAQGEAAETRKALQWAKDKLRLEGKPTASLRMLIFRLLKDAAEYFQRLPEPDRKYLLQGDRSSWPEVYHTPKERYEAELQRLIDLKEGGNDLPRPRITITDPTAERRALHVYGWLSFVTGKYVKEDQEVVLRLSLGQSYRQVRHALPRGDISDFAIVARKTKVLKQIEQGLKARGVIA